MTKQEQTTSERERYIRNKAENGLPILAGEVGFLIDQLDEARKMLGELLTRSYAQAPNRDDELKWVCLECATSPWTDTLEECRRSHNESCVAGKAERVLKEGK